MKKIISVLNKKVADELESLGFNYIIQDLGDRKMYSFVESDKLFKIVSDKSRFSKKDWFIDNKLRF